MTKLIILKRATISNNYFLGYCYMLQSIKVITSLPKPASIELPKYYRPVTKQTLLLFHQHTLILDSYFFKLRLIKHYTSGFLSLYKFKVLFQTQSDAR